MRVLHLLDTINRGGAEMQALDVCRNARRYGIELTFVTAQGGAMEKDFQGSGAEYFKLSRRLSIDLTLVLKLRKIIKDQKIELVQSYQAVDGLHCYLATLGLPVKQVLSYQGFISDRKNLQTLRFLIPRMDANICVSKGLLKWLEKNDKLDTSRNFYVIYNGADPARLAPSGKSLKKELSLSADTLLFGMIGNFYRDRRKDQMTLCESLPKVFAEIKDARCVFAGSVEAGAEEKFQMCVDFCRENAIAEKVFFLGGREDVPDVLDALDLFVFSSLHEGLPVAVSEAMLGGVPMIVSDIEPLLEASGNGKYAEVFPVQNAEVLSEKILNLLKDKSQRESLAACAFRFASENLSIEAHLRELEKLYQTLLQQP